MHRLTNREDYGPFSTINDRKKRISFILQNMRKLFAGKEIYVIDYLNFKPLGGNKYLIFTGDHRDEIFVYIFPLKRKLIKIVITRIFPSCFCFGAAKKGTKCVLFRAGMIGN